MPVNPTVPSVLLEEPLLTRRLAADDAERLHPLFSDASAVQFWDLPPATSLDDTAAWIGKSVGTPTAYHAAWAVLDRSAQSVIGLVSYYDREPWQDKTRVSFLFMPDSLQPVTMGPVIRRLVDFCFDHLRSNRVEFLGDPADEIAARVLTDIGFARDGVLRQTVRVQDVYRDRAMFSMLADDWRTRNGKTSPGRDSSALLWRLPKGDPGKNIAEWERTVRRGRPHVNEDMPLSFAGRTHLHGDTLDVLIDDRTSSITAPGTILRAILEAGSGYHTIDDMIAHVPPRFDRGDVRGLVLSLIEQGILIPSSSRMENEWRWLTNPPVYRTVVKPELAEKLALDADRDVATATQADIVLTPPKDSATARVQRRATCREFSGAPLNDETLASILYCAYGVLDKPRAWRDKEMARRTVPSAGGIYPLRLTWVQLRDSQSVGAGVYRVGFGHDRRVMLDRISADHGSVLRAVVDPTAIVDAHGVLIVSADFERARSKYGNRAVLLTLTESGHVAQNVALAAADLDIGILELGGFFDGLVKKISAHPECEPVLAIAIGAPKSAAAVSDARVVPSISFDWIDHHSPHALPFHLARARVDAGKKATDWCWGRSGDPKLAMVKAVAESVERLACQWPQRLVWARAADLPSHVPPDALISYPKARYRDKHFALAAFDPDREYPWIEVKQARDGTARLVLADTVFFNNAFGEQYQKPYSAASTSGAAAYTDVNGAFERALLELLERHCFMYAWMTGTQCPRVDVATLPGDAQTRIAHLARNGWDISVLLASEQPVTTFIVTAKDRRRNMLRLASCAGFNREEAVLHALTEVESAIPSTYNDTARRDQKVDLTSLKSPQDHGDLYLNRRYGHKADWLFANPQTVDFREIAAGGPSTADVIAFFHQHDMPIYSVDITPPITPPMADLQSIYVIRVLVERLLTISFGYKMETTIPKLTIPLIFSNDTGKKVSIHEKGRYFPHPFF